MAGNSITVALTGKLLPQTLVFLSWAPSIMFIYTVSCTIPVIAVYCPCCCRSVISTGFTGFRSISVRIVYNSPLGTEHCLPMGSDFFLHIGYEFPVMAMNPVLQALANLFPLRHYFLIYVDLALNGYPLIYAWHSIVALMLFMLLPFFILKRLRTVLLHYVYIP